MENQTNSTLSTNDLLEKQNQILAEILHILKRHEQKEFRNHLITFIAHAIPYIAIVVLGYYVYTVLQGYLDALNHNITILRDSYLNLQQSITNLIPDFSGIGDKLQSTWQNVKSVF